VNSVHVELLVQLALPVHPAGGVPWEAVVHRGIQEVLDHEACLVCVAHLDLLEDRGLLVQRV